MTGTATDEAGLQEHVFSQGEEAAGEAVQRPEGPAEDGHRAGHVADRLRRPVLPHDVRGQADAGHKLMQAIARVNRVFKDKPGGLVVDYIGIAAELRSALQDVHRERGRGSRRSRRRRRWPCWGR